MQIRHDIYPGSPKVIDNIVKGDTIVWTLNCKTNNSGTMTPRNLTGLTNYLGVLRDALQNPCTAMTDTTTGSNVVVTTAATGVLTVTLTGSWTLPFQPGLWTLSFTAMNGTDIVVLGKIDINLTEQTGS